MVVGGVAVPGSAHVGGDSASPPTRCAACPPWPGTSPRPPPPTAGVVHVDHTARVQTVDRAAAPEFAAVIEHFRQITDVPVVLNTSFNDQEPIVETSAHALATFQACDLDALCIGDYLVERA
ncbi:carbamoyltransferase C-terminal domain-containing protein [Acrocarpospora pleiomorpha]|uniref:carbamoyltransferase C-terminal domain-containing protein n=1 Tax=Acrocarpospora pleiomorpha TaxID=90975 RepID=UPI001478E67E|nr:carbamoyltransferase C-terminal domain-containing protein [Acrocarpospora pleiomorpha]